jgi:hypothetical protein
VTDHGDQLREAFETHENLAPDPAAVYAKVEGLARTYRRRRLGAQVAGGTVLGAGLIAGVMTVPGVLPAGPDDGFQMVAPAAAPATPSVSPPGAPPALRGADPQQAAFDAYFQAGYGYDEAVQLAKLWNKPKAEIGSIKAEAGRRLLAGETLPVPASPDAPVTEEPVDPQEEARFSAFFNAGYVYSDAERLAKMWRIDDPSDAKIEGGKRLLAGQKLPIKPKPANVTAAKRGQQVEAFWKAGYDYEDATKLADLWNLKDASAAKAEAGKRLLAGQTLPLQP